MYSSGLLLLLLGTSFARGQLRNVTIDDGMGDLDSGAIPVYSGSGHWRTRGQDNSCPECYLNPVGDRMVGGTWHDATINNQELAEITFSFKGTNLFVFCTLAGIHTDSVTDTHLTLFVDDISSPDFQYQYQVLEAKDMENRDHTVKVLSHQGVVNGQPVGSLILFDYALYTTDTSNTGGGASSGTAVASTPSSSTTTTSPFPSSTTVGFSSIPSTTTHPQSGGSNLALSVGIACGVVALVLSIGALVLFLGIRRRRRHQTQLKNVHNNWPPTSSTISRSTTPPMLIRPIPVSEPSTLPLNLGPPVVTSASNRKLNLWASLVNEKPVRSGHDDAPPPSYS